MTTKELAYTAQQHLQASTGSLFKRAHVYELLAASFGFNSYAALISEAVFTQRDRNVSGVPQNTAAIRQRCVALGYQPDTADVASSELAAFVASHQIEVVRLSHLVAGLRNEWSLDQYSEWDNDDHEDVAPEKGLAPAWSIMDVEEIPLLLLDGLETAARNGSAVAHYALALINRSDEDDDDQQVGRSYWYSQEQKGRVLTGVEKMWAAAYAHELAIAEKHEFHLREAARLGNRSALLDLADEFDDPSFFDTTNDVLPDDPWRIAEIAERLNRMEDVRHWLSVAAEAGDTEAMRQLIEEFDHNNLQRCWTWLYLAQLCGKDLSRSEYYLINEDGSLYDDDVGGPALVDGRDGVELEPLSAEQDAAARHAAEEIFERLQQAG